MQPGVDIGSPASVAAGNRAAAAGPPDLTPVLDQLQQVGQGLPPEDQQIVDQCLQALAQVQAKNAAGTVSPVANGAGGMGGL